MTKNSFAMIAILLLLPGCAGLVDSSTDVGGGEDESSMNITVVSEEPAKVQVQLVSIPTVNGSQAKYVVLSDGDSETMDAVLIQNQSSVMLTNDRPVTNSTRIAFQNANGTRTYVDLPE